MAEIKEIVSKEAIKGILVTDKAIIKLDDSIIKINQDIENLSESIKNNSNTLKDLNAAQIKVKQSNEDVDKVGKQLTTTNEKLKQLEDERTKVILRNKDAIKERTAALKREIKEEEGQIGTLAKLRQKNKELRKEKETLNLETKEGTKRLQEINSELDSNNEKIKESADAYVKTKINIGNYEDSIKSALESTNAFQGGTTSVINNFIEISQQEGGVKKFFGTFVGGIKGATRAALAFIATPLGAVIAAVVVGLGTLRGALKRNQEAADKFRTVFAGIKNVFEEVIGRAFKLAGALVKLVQLKFKEAFEQGKEAVQGFGSAMKDAYQEGKNLEQMEIDLEEQTIKSTATLAKLTAEIEKLSVVQDDATRSFKEREDAAESLRSLEAARAGESLRLAQQELKILTRQVNIAERQGRLTRELRQQEQEAISAVMAAEGELARTRLANEKERRQLTQDRLERDLDILIDGFDNVKTINERILQDDRKTLTARQKLLDDTTALADASYGKQLETLQQFTDKQIDLNDLVATSDAELLNQKIRDLGLSEIIEGRILEVVRERRIVIQDLAEAQRDLNDEAIEQAKQLYDEQKEMNDLLVQSSIDETNLIIENKTREADARINLAMMSAATEEELAQATFDIQKTLIEEQIDSLQDLLDVTDVSAEQRLDIEQQLADARQELDNLVTDNAIENEERRVEKLRESLDTALGLTTQVGDAIFSIRSGNLQKELQLAEGNEQKQKEIQLRIAKNDRNQALFSAAISTAQAILKATASAPFPANLPGIIFATTIGALQTAAILSQPLPQFGGGTENAPSEFIAGERGRELMILPSGEAMMVDRPTYFKGSTYKGARIFPNTKTEEMINQTTHGGFTTDDRLLSEIRGLRGDIKGMSTPIYQNDVWGYTKNNTRTRLLNKYRRNELVN